MSNKRFFYAVLIIFMTFSAAFGAVITENDSTQPRGAPPATNSDGQRLDPVVQGFMSPAFRGQQDLELHFDWSGMMMAQSMRDPAAISTLMVANRDFINYANSLPGSLTDPTSAISRFLTSLKLEKDITTRNTAGKLQPESKLPVIADWCLRCHAPGGWLEGHSEPKSFYSPFLKGQFWGAAFKEYPGFPGTPRTVRLNRESEAEMDGVQCDFCHRASDNFKRASLFDGSNIPNGNGGFFVNRFNLFGQGTVDVAFDFQGTAEFCGTCHDVTNPLFKTKTVINGSVPDMFQPLERTFTEWYWSDYGSNNFKCQECHTPMKFPGAQTWMLYPGMTDLWGAVDTTFTQPPYRYGVPAGRNAALQEGRLRNIQMLKTAASMRIMGTPVSVTPGQTMTAEVQIINNTGHKLPTGYSEGRQMWIHLKATDAAGIVIYESGALDPATGEIVDKHNGAKVYEFVGLAKDYDSSVAPPDSEFHFALVNFTAKDNRIPPVGFNKAAYTADGAFIIPSTIPGDPPDTDYPDGQNWDVTTYSIPVPTGVTGPILITAELRYQTFSREYVDFLKANDIEKTKANGGRARNIPTTGIYGSMQTWGAVNAAIWTKNGKGRPVNIDTAQALIPVR
jgi:hypothetical protein